MPVFMIQLLRANSRSFGSGPQRKRSSARNDTRPGGSSIVSPAYDFVASTQHGVRITPECDVIDSFGHAAPSCQFPACAFLCVVCSAAGAGANHCTSMLPPRRPTSLHCTVHHRRISFARRLLLIPSPRGSGYAWQSCSRSVLWRFLQCSQCVESWNRVFRASCKTLRPQ